MSGHRCHADVLCQLAKAAEVQWLDPGLRGAGKATAGDVQLPPRPRRIPERTGKRHPQCPRTLDALRRQMTADYAAMKAGSSRSSCSRVHSFGLPSVTLRRPTFLAASTPRVSALGDGATRCRLGVFLGLSRLVDSALCPVVRVPPVEQ